MGKGDSSRQSLSRRGASLALRAFAIAALMLACFRPLSAQQYAFRNDSKAKGLRNQSVNTLVQDRAGFLWVGTEAGLYRYDGTRYELVQTVEGHDDPFITSIYEDGAGDLWISTLHSLVYRDARGIHNPFAGKATFDFDPRSTLVALPNRADGVYFISAHTLFAVRTADHGKSWRFGPAFDKRQVDDEHPQLANIVGGYTAGDGHVWLGCGNRVCEVSERGIRVWTDAEGVTPDRWRTILATPHGVWIRGDRHISVLLPGSAHFVATEQWLSLTALGIRGPRLVEDPQGRILANVTGGLARWENGRWTSLAARNGIPTADIQIMHFDRDGVLRLGGSNRGVDRWLGYDVWESWTTQSGLSHDTVWAVFEDRHRNLWVANEHNIDRFAPGAVKPTLELDNRRLPARQMQTIAETADGHLWIGSDNGTVADYNPADGQVRIAARVHGVFQLFRDRSDRLWIASLSGLFFLDSKPHRHVLHQVPDAAIPAGNVYRATQDAAGVLWFTTANGIYRFDGVNWSRISFPFKYQLVFSADIAQAPDGSFWVPMIASGLVHWRMVDGHVEVLDRVDLSQRMSPYVILVQIDRRGWLWVGTDVGLGVFNGREWRFFTEDDGLVWNDTDSGAFYSAPDGSVWIGTSGGLAHVRHPEALFAKQPIKARVSEIRLGDAPLSADSSGTSLPWGHHTLTFHLSSSNFDRADVVKFRYLLAGLEDKWLEAPGGDVRYPPLAAGHYRLAVIAVDKARNEESAAIYVEFEIRPPWWRSNAFYGIAAISCFLLSVTAWRWSTRFLIARRNHLATLVKQRTAELEAEKAALVNARAALMEQATHDFLTGLLNRGAIYSVLEREMQRASRERSSFPIVLADIDHFKRINDTYGHLLGDQVLREFASRLKAALRPYDQTGRYGGEEFLILMPGLAPADFLQRIAEVHGAITGDPMIFGEIRLQVTCSFGVACVTQDSESAEMVVDSADQALYKAKANGRNRFEFAEGVEEFAASFESCHADRS